MTKTLTYLLLLVSTFCFSQNKFHKDSLQNSYSILTSNRGYSNKHLGITREEYQQQHDIIPASAPSTDYYLNLRHLYFGLDSTYIEVVQYPDLSNMNLNNDLYAFKDTCYLKEAMIAWVGHYTIVSDTIYLRNLNLLIYDNAAYSNYDLFSFRSSYNVSLFKQSMWRFENCRFDYKKTREFFLKNSELYDMTGKKWFGFK